MFEVDINIMGIGLTLNGETAILLLATVVAILVVTAVWSAFNTRDDRAERTKALITRREELKAEALELARSRRQKKNVQAIGAMRQVVDRMKLFRQSQTDELQMSLSQAGYRGNDAMTVFLFCKWLAGPVVFGGISAFSVLSAPRSSIILNQS